MKKLLLLLAILPSTLIAQYNVDYTVTILRLKANADDCDGGAPFCINAPQDPVFNIWTNDASGNINTNCWIYENDNAADYGVWIDIQNLEIANETSVNTSYINVEMAGHESDNIGSASCSPDGGDDAVISQQLAQQFDLLLIPENIPYVATVDIQNTYFAEIEIVWDNLDTGIDELNNQLAFVISPNPSNGVFTIELGAEIANLEMRVYDLSGRTIMQDVLTGSTHNVHLNEKSGVYFVELITEDRRIGRKKIILR